MTQLRYYTVPIAMAATRTPDIDTDVQLLKFSSSGNKTSNLLY